MINRENLIEFVQEAYNNLSEFDEGCYIYELFDNNLCLVIGKTEDGICGKLAVNIDDLYYDYEYDWNMPFYENGEVYDTDTIINPDDIPSFVQTMINEFNILRKLKIARDGLIVEDDEDIPESLEEDVGKYKIKYWVDEDHRDLGISDIFGYETDIEEAKRIADKLFDEYASVEVLDSDDEVVYGRYPEEFDESLKESKEEDLPDELHVNLMDTDYDFGDDLYLTIIHYLEKKYNHEIDDFDIDFEESNEDEDDYYIENIRWSEEE